MKIHFLGGTGTVTGSKTVVELNETRILIDCGLFQGIKSLRDLNWQPLAIEPATIDFVLLTHGHLDHCGWLPILVKNGFKGKIFCTAPTKQIAKLILADSAKIQEEEASKANQEHFSKHNPAEPLYTVDDAERVTSYFRAVDQEIEVKLTENSYFKFFQSGHILGACSIELNVDGKVLVFSGDVGQDDDVLMYPPKKTQKADYVFLESTYGNRLHPQNDVLLDLEMIINTTINRGGNVVIPSFAVERAQTVMYLLWQLRLQNRIPDIPYIIDTPMGIKVLDIFNDNPKWHKLNPNQCEEMCSMFSMISDFEDTINAIYDKRPKVVIAASGMITGGRVLSYLERYIIKPENTVMLVGYQAEGTRGRKLLEGAKEIKFFGKYYPVEAEVVLVEGLSAHGDQQDLLNWLSELKQKPQKIFLVHGENEAADTLRTKIFDKYGFEATVPLLGQVVEI
ncbi:MAG TPA: MBL fold metallo-hydrolase [Flavobacterium sp.]|uniref:MBL fold metallo-hydrolase RNA specificity domain-containing protein n=1 Tax=unclassified Flavobacterium TaxID=196869 RepID=UPI000E8FF586|nr:MULTISPECIES: MBL fold metallo-hydrolase [unclassified Flavobacterium]HBI01545.1 MBL fold metallo-hydrolase [Flavobacterium sp.]HRE78523.1 MBL fold metallo-hydrolase [Flavobacterium sp.]